MALTAKEVQGFEGNVDGEIQEIIIDKPVVKIYADGVSVQIPTILLKDILTSYIDSIPHGIKAAVGDFV